MADELPSFLSVLVVETASTPRRSLLVRKGQFIYCGAWHSGNSLTLRILERRQASSIPAPMMAAQHSANRSLSLSTEVLIGTEYLAFVVLQEAHSGALGAKSAVRPRTAERNSERRSDGPIASTAGSGAILRRWLNSVRKSLRASQR